jgi:hypothetical protein
VDTGMVWKEKAMSLFEIINNGQKIESTNYFDSDHAMRGLFYLSTNAGCVRLLVPDVQQAAIQEFKAAEYAILSRGPWPEQSRSDALELLFEDFSDSPYAIHMVIEQRDVLPDGKGYWELAVWTREGKCFECPLKFRKVERIPCLLPWHRLPPRFDS